MFWAKWKEAEFIILILANANFVQYYVGTSDDV